uniref:4-coumarate--CoA ligase-like 1-like n=1 Tax=Saccoglossus kowalevskii TaxID=10224 RepID=A0ABM0MMS8_SACKO|nr:PREDICTED: 4-coumarate--CoA ligase-like 1-like [Saccoglossus kowalevskii]
MGDIGHYDAAGNFFVVDRLKELIKFKGFQVAPAELEDILLTHPEIQDAAVIGVPDEYAGELPKAIIVAKTDTLTPEDVVRFMDGRVAHHKKLRGGAEILKELPKSQSGKILRRILRDREKELKKNN